MTKNIGGKGACPPSSATAGDKLYSMLSMIAPFLLRMVVPPPFFAYLERKNRAMSVAVSDQ